MMISKIRRFHERLANQKPATLHQQHSIVSIENRFDNEYSQVESGLCTLKMKTHQKQILIQQLEDYRSFDESDKPNKLMQPPTANVRTYSGRRVSPFDWIHKSVGDGFWNYCNRNCCMTPLHTRQPFFFHFFSHFVAWSRYAVCHFRLLNGNVFSRLKASKVHTRRGSDGWTTKHRNAITK